MNPLILDFYVDHVQTQDRGDLGERENLQTLYRLQSSLCLVDCYVVRVLVYRLDFDVHALG